MKRFVNFNALIAHTATAQVVYVHVKTKQTEAPDLSCLTDRIKNKAEGYKKYTTCGLIQSHLLGAHSLVRQ